MVFQVSGSQTKSHSPNPNSLVIEGLMDRDGENDGNNDDADDSNFYEMKNKYRGIAVIFDHYKFNEEVCIMEPQTRRPGDRLCC